MKKSILLLSMALLFSAPVMAEESEPQIDLNQDVVILYTSDVHCGVEKGFGYVGLQQIRQTCENNGAVTILVDDGDAIQGEPLGTMTEGKAVVDLMNDLKYDVVIPGNHEFDYGMDVFLNLAQNESEHPYICCNFLHEGEPVFDSYWIKEVDGIKIGFVGVTTPQTITSSTPSSFMDEDGNYVYSFLQEDTSGQALYDCVQNAVDSVRAEGADYVICLAHLGNEAECSPWTYAEVIANTSGIDALLDGHSHDLDQVTMLNKDGEEVIRSAVGTKLNAIGSLTISAEDGSIESDVYYWPSDVSAPKLLALENDMSEKIADATTELNEALSQVVAESAVDLQIYDQATLDSTGEQIRIIRNAETNLGDFVADAYRAAAGSDIAFANGGGIRTSIPKGDITLNDILVVHPYGNLLCRIEVTGQQILDALEWGARAVPGENGGFLQVSGMTYEIHTYIESSCQEDDHGMFTGVDGEYRVKNVMIGGEPLDLEKTYTLCSHNYMLKDYGDGFTMFDGSVIQQDDFILDNQSLIDYAVETLGGVIADGYTDPYGDGRIVAVDEAPAEAETEAE